MAVSFIIEAIKDSNCKYLFAVSQPVYNNLKETIKIKMNIELISPSPARIIVGAKSRKKIMLMEHNFKPDIVFTIFGPSYIKFSGKHLCGIADGWVTHMSMIAFNSLPLLQKPIFLLRSMYKKLNLLSKDYYWVETEIAKQGLIKVLKVNAENIKVIPNTYSSIYPKQLKMLDPKKTENEIKLLTISAPYNHKNLKIIPDVAKLLHENDKINKYKFLVTLPDDLTNKVVKQFWDKAEMLSVKSMIHNLGVLKNHECPYWYRNSDIVFMPTLLETSSAVYPESMFMGKPIITTDLDFAHASCGDASLYYEPLSADSASDAIIELCSDNYLKKKLILKGKRQLKSFPKPNEKYTQINNYIKTIINN